MSTEEACRVLGVSSNEAPEVIRAAYLRLLKEHPPETGGEAFERIRDAYQMLTDPARRSQRVLEAGIDLPLESLVDAWEPRTRHHVGPKPWLDFIKGTTN